MVSNCEYVTIFAARYSDIALYSGVNFILQLLEHMRFS